MRLIRHPHLSPSIAGTVVTVGNFEGLHLGHQVLLEKLVAKSKELGLPAWLITFVPHSKEYFLGSDKSLRLMTFASKLKQLKAKGIAGVMCLKFNETLAQLSPQDFVRTILIEKLQCRYLVVGDDFHFGHQRCGNQKLLNDLSQPFGFETFSMPSLSLNAHRISSTLVREKLQAGMLDEVELLLGRAFSFSAHVQHGEKRGRLLGFPTANLIPPAIMMPAHGVYHVRIKNLDRPFHGVANLGLRPTVDGKKFLCEVHLFDCDQDLYGKKLKIEFLKKIRDERRFESLEALRFQINEDVQTAKAMAAHY